MDNLRRKVSGERKMTNVALTFNLFLGLAAVVAVLSSAGKR